MKPRPKKLGLAAGWMCVMRIKRQEVPSSAVATGSLGYCESVARRLTSRAAVDVDWIAKECSK